MKAILIQVFIYCTLSYSQNQNISELFYKYIPDTIKNNKEGMIQINENLNQATLLHPSLIYYYLEHLNLRFNENITKPDSNFFKIYSAQRNEIRKKKNDFALRQEDLIEKKNFVRIKENAMLSCIDDLFTDYDEDIFADTSVSIDNNRQNYYSLAYFTGMNSDYDPGTNYSELLQEEISKKINNYKTKKMNFSSMNKEEKLTFISEMNQDWYFADKDEKFFNQKLDFEPNELAQEIFQNDFFINENFIVGVFYYPVNKHLAVEETENISVIYKATGSTGNGREINTEFDIEFDNIFSVAAGYRLKLENEYAALSYLDFNLGFSINRIEIDPSFGSTFFQSRASRPGEYIDAIGYIEKEGTFTYSILSKVIAPIFYLNSVLHFKAGILYELRLNSFDYNIIIEETITDLQGNQIFTDFKETRNYSHTNHLLLGVVSINASVTDYLDLVLEGNFSTKIGVGLGAAFNF